MDFSLFSLFAQSNCTHTKKTMLTFYKKNIPKHNQFVIPFQCVFIVILLSQLLLLLLFYDSF